MMSTPAATSVESVREKRAIVTFSTTSPIFIGSLQLERVPLLAALLGLLPAEERPETGRDDEQHVRPVFSRSDAVDDVLRQRRQLAAELREDLHEDRDEEHEHPAEDERREAQHHRRVDHRALDAALDRLLLLDLEGDAVEHDVEDAGRLAGLDHRDVEAGEDLRVARHRLGEQQTALDVLAQLVRPRRRALRRRSAPRG